MYTTYKESEWPNNLIKDLIRAGAPIESLPDDFEGSLEYVLHSLPDKRGVATIRMRYEQQMTLSEIGKAVGVSSQRAQQIINDQLTVLQNPIWIKYLRYGVREVELMRADEAWQMGVDAARAACEDSPAEEPANERQYFGSMDISDLWLSARATNCLRRAGVRTVDDLLELGYRELRRQRNLGAKTYDEIIQALEVRNIACDQLKPDE